MKERRKDPRIGQENKVALNPLPDGRRRGAKDAACCLTRDVSMGGIRVITDAPLEVGSRVTVELTLTKSKTSVRAAAKVRWVKEIDGKKLYDMGLEFVEIAPEDELALIDHIYGKPGFGG
jgi:c-di-GMP-binding flagellar brake protein YcgR